MKLNHSTKSIMNRVVPISVLAIAILACGGEKTNTSLTQLKADKARFKDSITAIDAQIAKQDTAKASYAKVTFYNVTESNFEHFFSVQGNVNTDKDVVLVPEAGGLITSLNVKEGALISKGAIVARFNSDIVASNIKEVEEQIDLAQYNFDKQTKLFDQGVGTEFNLRQAEGQLNALIKSKKTLQTQGGKSILRAPFSGYIEEVFPSVGEMAGPSSPIARIVNLDHIYVEADLSEYYLNKIGTGSPATVKFPALNILENDLVVTQMGRYVNPANRTIRLRVDLPKKDVYIPNLVAEIKIRDYSNAKAIAVPSSTILQDEKGNDIIYVVSPKEDHFIVAQRIIQVGETYNDETEVLEGLNVGDMVVHKGSRSVYDKLEVQQLSE